MGVVGEYSLCSCSGVCSQFWFERSLILISFDLETVSCCACWRSFFFQHDQFLWTREAAGFCRPRRGFLKRFFSFLISTPRPLSTAFLILSSIMQFSALSSSSMAFCKSAWLCSSLIFSLNSFNLASIERPRSLESW